MDGSIALTTQPEFSPPEDMDTLDEFDDAVSELPLRPHPFDSLPSLGAGGSTGNGAAAKSSKEKEKQIRRRSSKACDQCRKSKCKCERAGDGETCKSCVMLGTPCTFLGPSRKRGPPKGYIDAIESRLHQTEAVLGVLLAAGAGPHADARARTLLADLCAGDALAAEIVARVERGAYGRGRRAGADADRDDGDGDPPGAAALLGRGRMVALGQDAEGGMFSTHPSNEWQDHVTARIKAAARARAAAAAAQASPASSPEGVPLDDAAAARPARPMLAIFPEDAGRERQRRRMDSRSAERERDEGSPASAHPFAAHGLRGRASAASFGSSPGGWRDERERELSPGGASGLDVDSSGDEDGLTDAVGQLSLNEDAQVRYHGKASGLHLLGRKLRADGRNEGGIWRFPKARVWPPVAPTGSALARLEDEEGRARARLPGPATQAHLLQLYFAYVHPYLPVVHKEQFWEDFHAGYDADANGRDVSPASNPDASPIDAPRAASSPPGAAGRARARTPALLLLAMFALAARYAPAGGGAAADAELPPAGQMWPAGDSYLADAKVLLDRTYAGSRPSTCQALLLMAYREIGIGAMAQSWLYVGMAVRMAQDLGMHRSSDRWQRVGELLFSARELQVRKRIWYACVIMDKYVSTYIGRPLSIFERDYDTQLPSVDEIEERELWEPHTSPAVLQPPEPVAPISFTPVPGRLISCFNASATLSSILSVIVQAIYAIRPALSRHAEAAQLEKKLDLWYIDLPAHLRYESASKAPVPPPHVLTLHMQYWCAVLLLHRPFMRHYLSMQHKMGGGESPSDAEVFAASKKNYDLCVSAANHITAIVSVYSATFCLKRSSVFLSYYIFTASITHVTTLATAPDDPQARMGLAKCMDALKRMAVVWPSAERAWELLHGAKDGLCDTDAERALSAGFSCRRLNKRAAGDVLEGVLDDERGHLVRGGGGSSAAQGFAPSGAGYGTLDLGGGGGDPALTYFSSYDRWAADSGLVFPAGLSTSVLPQQYSTGFADHRGGADAARAPGPAAPADAPHGGRYPQYWSDYSALGQPSSMLGSIYGMSLVPPGTGPHHPHAAQPLQGQAPMYDQYGMFNGLHS